MARKRSKRVEHGSGGRPCQPARARAKRRRRATSAAAILAALVLLVAVAAGWLIVRSVDFGASTPPARTAVIVDQLSLTQPNPAFGASATTLLQQAGYEVDYFPGEQVTVDFYRTLPGHGYELIILRAHSGRIMRPDRSNLTDYVGLFTSEPYTQTEHVDEQRAKRLLSAWYAEGTLERYFGITSDFVRSSMRGRFDDSLVVVMGCDGLRSQAMAQAFLDKGASALVGWSDLVSAEHTDAATLRLLEKLVIEGLTPKEAVAQTAAEVGPDPAYGAELRILESDGG